jgi:hypothetical protein
MKRIVIGAITACCALLAGLPAVASAAGTVITPSTPGVEHLHYAAGPYKITPGANLILVQANQVPKPNVDGFMIRMRPSLTYALPNGQCCGKVPSTSLVHLHHGVWLTNGQAGQGEGNGYPGFYPFMAAGEEKTAIEFPSGYGYPIGAHDTWILNYMIHNLTSNHYRVFVTYDIDFIPATSPLASQITPAHPIWMDVQDHHIYPVFNVKRGSGVNGKFTYPDMAKDPYGSGPQLNEFTVDHAGVLLGTAGHLHPGGLYDDLDIARPGVTTTGGNPAGVVPDSVRLFRSNAIYYDKRGPVSWDWSATATAADWRPVVKPGDQLTVHATYDTKRASWYEVMGIMVVWEAWGDTRGVDPFTHKLDETGHVTHGHLAENSYYGGSAFVGVNPNSLPTCHPKQIFIAGFRYLQGDISSKKTSTCLPTIHEGQSIEFTNEDASTKGAFDGLAGALNPSPFYLQSIFHTVTSCQKPCGRNYGIAYPLANGAGNFDSGELGIGTPGIGTVSWNTPTGLKPGTYTFFCRIHPWMRGVFQVIGPAAGKRKHGHKHGKKV